MQYTPKRAKRDPSKNPLIPETLKHHGASVTGAGILPPCVSVLLPCSSGRANLELRLEALAGAGLAEQLPAVALVGGDGEELVAHRTAEAVPVVVAPVGGDLLRLVRVLPAQRTVGRVFRLLAEKIAIAGQCFPLRTASLWTVLPR